MRCSSRQSYGIMLHVKAPLQCLVVAFVYTLMSRATDRYNCMGDDNKEKALERKEILINQTERGHHMNAKREIHSRIFAYALFVLTPFIALLILGVVTKTNPFRIDMRLSYAGDEMTYAQGVKTILSYGSAQGLMTYNEAQSVIPAFGAWSPVVFYSYALIALLIGGWHGYNTIMFVSVTMVVLASAIFLLIVKPDTKRTLWLSFFMLGMWLLQRYIWSGTSEGLFIALSIVLAGLSIKLFQRTAFDGKTKLLCWAIMLASIIFGACRPYGLAFSLFPIAYTFMRSKSGDKAIGQCIAYIVLAVVGLLIYLALLHYACAPYFDIGVTGFGLYRNAFESFGLIGVIKLIAHRIIDYPLGVFSAGVRGYAIAGVVCLEFFILLSMFIRTVQDKEPQTAWLFGSTLLAVTLIFIALALLSVAETNYRYLLCICIIMAFVILYSSHSCARRAVILLAAFIGSAAIAGLQCNLDTLMLPNATQEQAALFETAASTLQETLHTDPNDPWGNTIDWDATVPYPEYNVLFDTPAGIAIGIMWPEYYREAIPNQTLKAKYLFTVQGSEAYQLALQVDYSVACVIGDKLILENPYYLRNAAAE